jgi:oxygen-independent coproporphyrinogen-3 oxidase
VALQLPPLSLYIHLPWCVRKCPYCDFNSHAMPDRIPQKEYVDALLADLDRDLPFVTGRTLTSVFFGGGTPSLFTPEEIGRVLEGVRSRFGCDADLEVTLEANPGTIEHGRFAGYRAAGVNRVSLGAQSFNAQHLQLLGRIHGATDIPRAVDELALAGLDNFNLDLMYGLPEQTTAQAVADLETALALAPAHISHYQLTLEPGTVFYHRPPRLPDDDATWEMQTSCQDLLAARGYEQYEVSAYAKAGRQCRHNLNYWRFGDYLGIGAGAHGKLTLLREARVVRTVRRRQPRDYLSERERPVDMTDVATRDLPFEFMLNALRLTDGFEMAWFEERTGLLRTELESALQLADGRGLLCRRGDAWTPTSLGKRFLNDLQAMFLPQP